MTNEQALREMDTRALLFTIARRRADVSRQRAQLVVVRAETERAIIEAAGGEKALGANEAGRERAMTLALADDDGYQQQRRVLAVLEDDLARLEAEWDARRYELRRREVAAAERALEPNG